MNISQCHLESILIGWIAALSIVLNIWLKVLMILTSSGSCVIIKTDVVEIRTNPSFHYQIPGSF